MHDIHFICRLARVTNIKKCHSTASDNVLNKIRNNHIHYKNRALIINHIKRYCVLSFYLTDDN